MNGVRVKEGQGKLTINCNAAAFTVLRVALPHFLRLLPSASESTKSLISPNSFTGSITSDLGNEEYDGEWKNDQMDG